MKHILTAERTCSGSRILKLLVIWFILLLSGCGGSNDGQPSADGEARFAVISDPHLFAPELLTAGPAFQIDSAKDRTLLELSYDIFAQTVSILLEQEPRPQFLLIPGDLTKDGEHKSHELMVQQLQRLAENGIGVFVVPGNHDIANPEAFSYSPEGKKPVPSISAEEFATLYHPFGYAQALSRDATSLSYVAEPVRGVRLFALDTCRYQENNLTAEVGGRITHETIQWLKTNLQQALADEKKVIAMMHHPLLEHATGKATFLPDFVLENWQELSDTLADSGINLIFTGHFHAQQVTRRDWPDGHFVVDVQTGSLSAWPNPYRIVELNESAELSIESFFLTNLPGFDEKLQGQTFADYAHTVSRTNIQGIFENYSSNYFDLTFSQRERFFVQVNDALHAFYAGDQAPNFSTLANALSLIASEDPQETQIGLLLLSLWRKLPPEDNLLFHLLLPVNSSNGDQPYTSVSKHF